MNSAPLINGFILGFSLIVAIVSPALGTMFACTYFLMYDKKGIDEVVPSILQDLDVGMEGL